LGFTVPFVLELGTGMRQMDDQTDGQTDRQTGCKYGILEGTV